MWKGEVWFMIGATHKVFDILLQIVDYSFRGCLSNLLDAGHCQHLYLTNYIFIGNIVAISIDF